MKPEEVKQNVLSSSTLEISWAGKEALQKRLKGVKQVSKIFDAPKQGLLYMMDQSCKEILEAVYEVLLPFPS